MILFLSFLDPCHLITYANGTCSNSMHVKLYFQLVLVDIYLIYNVCYTVFVLVLLTFNCKSLNFYLQIKSCILHIYFYKKKTIRNKQACCPQMSNTEVHSTVRICTAIINVFQCSLMTIEFMLVFRVNRKSQTVYPEIKRRKSAASQVNTRICRIVVVFDVLIFANPSIYA